VVRYLACISDTAYTIVQVNPVPVVDLGRDTSTCGDTIILHSSLSYSNPTWLWSTGATTPTLPVASTGTYWLEVTENGCSGRDTVIVYINSTLAIDLGPDFNICDRDTPVVLSSPQPAGTHYLWSNGLSDTQMTVSRTGTYWVEVKRNDCIGSDTIRIGVIPTPTVYTGADSTICEQFPHRVGDEINGATYLWNTGETTPYINVSATSTYILEVNLQGCIVYDTIQITAMPSPDINLGPDDDICPEQTIVLNGSHEPGSSYYWSTGETTPSIAVTSAGSYMVIVTSVYGCIGEDSIVLSFYPTPTVILGEDTTVCEETPLQLAPVMQLQTDELRWSDGTVGDVLMVKYGGTYTVTAVNKCGTDADTIEIKQIFCEIMVPNAFSPNNDGINDVFRVLGNVGRMENFRLSIFSRWGELMFHTTDKYKGWDGIQAGHPALMGTYVYMLEYSIDGTPYLKKGNFHLIR
jgi:gliding motility-associated-like protein